MNKNLIKIQDKLKQENIDAIVLIYGENRFYATGFPSTSGFVFITQDSAYFLTDFRYAERAQKVLKNFKVELLNGKYMEYIDELCQKHNVKTLAFENKNLTYARYLELKEKVVDTALVDGEYIIYNLRMIKEEYEIENIHTGQKINEMALKNTLNLFQVGMTEIELKTELNYQMNKMGGDGQAFPTIIASATNSSMPHAVPTNKKISSGDFLTLDFGCVYNGYASDMTRTFCVSEASEKMRFAYNTVLTAQLAALDHIKAGIIGCDVDKVARDIINKNGFEGKFGHALGHSIGINVHESPRFSAQYTKEISENVIMSVEPGIYLEGEFGIRIEDLVVVIENGYKNLNNFTKELIIL